MLTLASAHGILILTNLDTYGVLFMLLNAHNPNLLTLEQARLTLNVSRQTIYNMVNRGELIPTKRIYLGKQLRRYFDRNDVLALRNKRNPDL